MLARVGMPNLMQSLVQAHSLLTRRVIWREIDDTAIANFPRLTESDLRLLTVGVYQVREALSYTAEHLSQEGMYQLFYHTEDQFKEVLFIKIQSRHHTGTSHKLFVHYIEGRDDVSGIAGWYCQCPAGNVLFNA